MIQLSKQTLLVISPHPDDEVLGCGGLIKLIKDAGGKVYVLFLSIGNTNEYSGNGKSTLDERKNEIENVAKYLKYDNYKIIFHGDKYHLRLDQIPQKDLIEVIENDKDISLNTLKPTIIATPHLPDYNQDHTSCTQAVLAATRPTPKETKPIQKIILGYESVATANWWSNTNENYSIFFELNYNILDSKIEAFKLYKSQVRFNNHPRSIDSIRRLANFRGIYAGANAVEAYICYRFII